jgi:hypothetical protein
MNRPATCAISAFSMRMMTHSVKVQAARLVGEVALVKRPRFFRDLTKIGRKRRIEPRIACR